MPFPVSRKASEEFSEFMHIISFISLCMCDAPVSRALAYTVTILCMCDAPVSRAFDIHCDNTLYMQSVRTATFDIHRDHLPLFNSHNHY